MNPWAKKSANIAAKDNYLDCLQEIYPSVPAQRKVLSQDLRVIRQAIKQNNKIKLLEILLRMDKFPYDESYKKFLKVDHDAIRRNPKTVDRICSVLFQMGVDGIITGVTAAKVPNQGRGPQFKAWAKRNFNFIQRPQFVSSSKGIVFLDASDENLRNYANSELGAGLAKRPDFIAKSGKKFVLGEAKFLSDMGGNQNGGFKDAMSIAGQASGRTIKVAILDGIVWLKTTPYYRQIETSGVYVFSALLLESFLTSINRRR